MAYIEVKTRTVPDSLTIKEAATIANRDTSQIHEGIKSGKLDHGFLMEGESRTGGTYETKGQKVIIKNAKWDRFLAQRKEQDKRDEKKTLVSAREKLSQGGVNI